VNKFPTDTAAEYALVQEKCSDFPNVFGCVLGDHSAKGSAGTEDLANAALDIIASGGTYRPLYDHASLTLTEKIETIATEIYRANHVAYSAEALTTLKSLQQDYGHFPVCIAKTQYSFSDDPSKLNAASDHTLSVSQVHLKAGAEFVVVQCGNIMTMPAFLTGMLPLAWQPFFQQQERNSFSYSIASFTTTTATALGPLQFGYNPIESRPTRFTKQKTNPFLPCFPKTRCHYQL